MPAERAAEDVGVRPQGKHLRSETHGEPRRVGLLDRLAHLGEAGGAGDEEAHPRDEQHRGNDADRGPPTRGDDEARGSIVTHLEAFGARHCQALRRATAPSAAPATASST